MPAHLIDPAHIGRPTEYRDEYAPMVIEFMAKGYSLTAFAGHIRVAKSSVYEWVKRHSAFSDAVHRARAARITALETKLLTATRGAQAATSIFALKNADPEEWQEVRNVRHDHTVKLETLTDAQLYAIASQRAGPDGTVIEGEYTRK
jgi:hypothetical protein